MTIYSKNKNEFTNVYESKSVLMYPNEDFTICFESFKIENSYINLSVNLYKEKSPKKNTLIEIKIFNDEYEYIEVFSVVLNRLVYLFNDIIIEKTEININEELYKIYDNLFDEEGFKDLFNFDVQLILNKKLILLVK